MLALGASHPVPDANPSNSSPPGIILPAGYATSLSFQECTVNTHAALEAQKDIQQHQQQDQEEKSDRLRRVRVMWGEKKIKKPR